MIAMPPLIPTEQWNALSLAIARGDSKQVNTLIEQHNLDVNAFDETAWMPVLMEVLLSYGFSTEEDRQNLLHTLLKRGANPSICCRKGYNCLHIAVQQDRYFPALERFLDFDADVNVMDSDGCNLAYWAIQTFLLRKKEDADRATPLRIMEKILLLGPDLDQVNRYGMTARGWLEHAAPEIRTLVARWEAGKPAIRPAHTIQPKFPANLHYPAIAQQIWTRFVPAEGTPGTIQGQLLQAVENLRDEAQRNGNHHYNKTHKRMAIFVRDTLTGSGLFDSHDNERIKTDTHKLMKASRPYVADDVYDELVNKVCIYYTRKADKYLSI